MILFVFNCKNVLPEVVLKHLKNSFKVLGAIRLWILQCVILLNEIE